MGCHDSCPLYIRVLVDEEVRDACVARYPFISYNGYGRKLHHVPFFVLTHHLSFSALVLPSTTWLSQGPKPTNSDPCMIARENALRAELLRRRKPLSNTDCKHQRLMASDTVREVVGVPHREHCTFGGDTEEILNSAKLAAIGTKAVSDGFAARLNSKRPFAEVIEDARLWYEQGEGTPDYNSLLVLDRSRVQSDLADYRSHVNIIDFLQSRSTRLRFPGANEAEIAVAFEGYPDLQRLLDLLKHGPKSCLPAQHAARKRPPFIQSSSLRDHAAVGVHHVMTSAVAGKVVILPLDSCPEVMNVSVASRVVLAPKAGTPNMRFCADLSHGIDSVNKSWDIDMSDALYPPVQCPTIRDICELACEQRVIADGESLEGATLDVATAYNQVINDGSVALQNVTQIMAPRDHAHDRVGAKSFGLGAKDVVWYIVISLVLQFGHVRASHIYGVFTRAIDWHHNRHGPRKSVTYVDDGIMIAAASKITAVMAAYAAIVVILFGPEGTNENKRVLWGTVMIAIGWQIDLDYNNWRVQPKPKAMLKMVAALFVRIPPGSTHVAADDLESVIGLLRWYCTGFRIGSAFLSTLDWALHAQANKGRRLIPLGNEALADLQFWRVLIAAVHENPGLFSVSIDHLRINLKPDIICFSDASSSIGAGAWFVNPIDHKVSEHKTVLRWTTEELTIIQSTEGMINVLEYFAAMHAMLVAGESLRGRVVQCNCDNTAAVAWLTKFSMRSTVPGAIALVQLFAVYATQMDIHVYSLHLPGVINIYADYLSRNPHLFDDVQQQDPVRATEDEQWWNGLPRLEVCRRCLLQLLTRRSPMPSQHLLRLVEALRE